MRPNPSASRQQQEAPDRAPELQDADAGQGGGDHPTRSGDGTGEPAAEDEAAVPPKRPAPEASGDSGDVGSSGPVPAGVRRALDDAARAVLDDPASWRWQALKPEEAEATMERLVARVAGEGDPPRDGENPCGGVAALALRLNELLRQELLDDPRGLTEPALVDVLRRAEACRAEIEPRDHQELALLLTGANAMELVVEFAHDLRSPLTSIMFLADTLRKGQSGEINDVQREQLGIMYSAALGMVSVANDLMDLARSEVDEAWHNSTEEPFSIRELVEKTRDMVAPMAEQKRLKVSFITPRHDSRIGYPILLGRVLLNLVTNALKFTEEGRVEIVVQDNPGEKLVFSVSDTGRGIDKQRLDNIYTLFDRSQSSTGYHFSGTGLGLSICRRLVEVMGGELKVESEAGKGSRFFFELELPRA